MPHLPHTTKTTEGLIQWALDHPDTCRALLYAMPRKQLMALTRRVTDAGHLREAALLYAILRTTKDRLISTEQQLKLDLPNATS